jgi:hypothetical protein
VNEFAEVLEKMVIAAEQLTLDAVHAEDAQKGERQPSMSHQVTYQFGFAEGLRAALALARSRARKESV